MSFETGLSGLSASSRSLDVIGNNIANANTTGMKSSRAEFSNLVASSLRTGGGVGSGIGVEVAAVSQQFSQGNVNITGNSLDVAINGGGFFQLKMPDGTNAYTRDGSFKLDKDGYLKTNAGANVMGYPTDKTGKPTSVTTQPLQLPTSAPIAANATTSITAELNLDARILDNTALPAAGKATNPRTTFGTSMNVFDAQGVASPVSLYFEKTTTTNQWDVFTSSDPAALSVGSVTFDDAGKIKILTTVPAATGFGLVLAAGTLDSLNPNATPGTLNPHAPQGAIPTAITVDLSTITQFGTAFAVSNVTQDGYTSGELTSLAIGQNGKITTSYSNGQTQTAGQLSLADFRNVQGLAPIAGNAWTETFASGQPVQGSPGVGKFGKLSPGALEASNVDLTAELVNMMTAQRAYQANAQTIKTQDQIMSTLVNLR